MILDTRFPLFHSASANRTFTYFSCQGRAGQAATYITCLDGDGEDPHCSDSVGVSILHLQDSLFLLSPCNVLMHCFIYHLDKIEVAFDTLDRSRYR